MTPTSPDTEAGQAVYSPATLAIYDLWVLGLSNRFVWRCPTPRQLAHYDACVTANHLDVGVGSGYYLDRCSFPSAAPRVGLLDLNESSLAHSARRVARYAPEVYRGDVLAPLDVDAAPFDSIGLSYLLHCLPGDIESKAAAIDHLRPLASPGATVFGSTLLQGGVERGAAARRLMAVYNRKGIFSNERDDLAGLERALEARLTDVKIEVQGCAALFRGRL